MCLSSGTVQEEDFPRGGASALTPLEVRKIKHEAEEDVLFGVKVIFLLFTTFFGNTILCKMAAGLIFFCFNYNNIHEKITQF